jgi:pimeloyl-ACP methyl ester carboxylesterase
LVFDGQTRIDLILGREFLMVSFVMIHGAWSGSWCFDMLRPLIEKAGHAMIAPDLPGMGGDEATLAAMTLEEWAQFTAELCRKVQGPVILCGHSRGGIVVSQAAEVAPEAIRGLIYICAMLLPSGMSREDMRAVNDPNPAFNAIRLAVPGGSILDAQRAPNILAQHLPVEQAKVFATQLVAEPIRPMRTALSLTESRYGTVPRHYIECLQDRTIPITDQRRMQGLQPCATVTTLDSDHSPFLTMPEALANALIAVAERLTEKA